MFIFGCILLAGFFLYFARRRLKKARWQGEQKSLRGVDFQIKTRVISDRFGHEDIWIGIAGAAGDDFSLRPETGFDRFCKSAGLVKEYQTGNPAFDEAVYILADDPDTQRAIAASPALMEAALALFAGIGKKFARIKTLEHRRGRLWLELINTWLSSEQDLRKTERFCVPRLAAISAALKARRMDPPGGAKTWRGAATELLLAAAMALASTGAALLFLLMLRDLFLGRVPYTLDWAALLVDALSLGGALLGALLLTGWLLIGNSARAHLVLLELLLAGGFGAFGVAWVELRYLNMEFDRSAAVDYEAQARGKRIGDGDRPASYYIEMDDWLRPGQSVELYVPQSLYEQTRPGAPLYIRQRAGRLGYRWVERVTAARPP